MENPNLIRPKYTVIMLIYHRYKRLVKMARDCAATVRNNSSDFEFIIVDNGSTVRHDWSEECDTYVRLDKNWGISHGWNTGIALARAENIVIIGDDIKATSGWLEAMKSGIDMPNAGMCNPRVEHLPGGIGIQENYKWPSGACFMINKNTLQKVGLFAEDDYFPANHEDWDYWTRIYQAGLKIYTNFSVTIHHAEGQTIHAEDISAMSEQTRDVYLKKWGFDPTPVFCGDVSIYDVLGEKICS